MTKVVFVPGNGNCTTKSFWFPYVENALKNIGIEVVAAEFPDPELARESYWIPFLLDELGVDEKTILVGHSSGAIASMRLAETSQILGSVLVGGYHTNLGMETEKQSGYFNKEWDWAKIKKNQEWTVIFASQDDPWIPIEEPRYIHKQLNCEYHEFIDQGHFGGDYNKETFPELITVLTKKLKVAV